MWPLVYSTAGGTPLYKPYRYVPPQRVWFLVLFGLKTTVYTLPILVWKRVWFSRELRQRMSVFVVSIPNEKERNRNMRNWNAFGEIFCFRSNLNNYDIISTQRLGLKTGMDFRGHGWVTKKNVKIKWTRNDCFKTTGYCSRTKVKSPLMTFCGLK